MSNARERILGRLRQAAPAKPLPAPAIDRDLLARIAAKSAAAPIERLAENLRAAHAEVLFCADGDWQAELLRLCGERGWQQVLLAPRLPQPEGAAGVRWVRFDAPIETLKAPLFDSFEVGVNAADCAIADTGTLVLCSGPDAPRTLSLVPPIHVCILDARRLHATLLDALRTERWSSAMPTNLIFVSGPSKTADIQQTLAYGAHGPRELIVLIHGHSGESR